MNTEKAYAAIVDIVNKAENKLVLISPFIKIPERLLERMKDADGKGSVEMTLVWRRDDLKPQERSELGQLRNLQLGFLESPHAKYFYNEKSMVITSLNLHEYSQQNNREMGILLSLKDEGAVFEEALDEAQFIARLAQPDTERRQKAQRQISPSKIKEHPNWAKSTPTTPPKEDYGVVGMLVEKGTTELQRRISKTDSDTKQKGNRLSRRPTDKGNCIRCGVDIPYDLNKPYCPNCYKEWSAWENPDYKESYCHTCCRPATTKILKPQCSSCFIKFRR